MYARTYGSPDYKVQDLGSQSHISIFSLLTHAANCMLSLQVAPDGAHALAVTVVEIFAVSAPQAAFLPLATLRRGRRRTIKEVGKEQQTQPSPFRQLMPTWDKGVVVSCYSFCRRHFTFFKP